MRLLFVIVSLATTLACAADHPAGARAPGSGGSGGDGSGESGGSGGDTGGTGGDAGGSGGEACADPVRCWIEAEEGWEPIPGLDFPSAPCTLDVAFPPALPETSLRWEPCGEGCARSAARLLDVDDEGAVVRVPGRIAVGGSLAAVARLSNDVRLGVHDYRLERLVRLSDGATLGAFRGRQARGDGPARCRASDWDARHPRLVWLEAVWAYGADTETWIDAAWLTGPATWAFRGSWGPMISDHAKYAVLGDARPVAVAETYGRVEAQLDPGSDAWTGLDAGPDVLAVSGDDAGTLAVWAQPGPPPGSVLKAWRTGGSVQVGASVVGTACHLAVLPDTVVADVVEDEDACRFREDAVHRLWSGPRDGPGGGGELGEPLVGGARFVVFQTDADERHVALQAAFDAWHDAVVVVVRRSDGLTRILRPPGFVTGAVLDGPSLYVAVGGDPSAALYRYELARLEELGEAP